jgi:hypothetical protein
MKVREHLITALKGKNIEFREQGDTIHMLSGDFNGAEINLKTGMLKSGDVDYFRGSSDAGKLGLLRQAYAQAEDRAVFFKMGHTMGERIEEKNGDVTQFVECRLIA